MDLALPFSMDQSPCTACCCLPRVFLVASAVDMLRGFSPWTSRTVLEGGNYHQLWFMDEYTESWGELDA